MSMRKSPPPRPGPRPPAQARPLAPQSGRRHPPGLWLYGTHAVLAALANPLRRCRRLVLTAEAQEGLGERLAEAALRRAGPMPPIEIGLRRDIDALLGGSPGAPTPVHQGIALACDPLPAPGLAEIAELAEGRERAVIVALDRITDPQNVGAILRSAAAFGALAVLVPEHHSPEEGAALAKAASGALEVVPLVRVVNLARALEGLKERGFWVAGLDGHADKTLAEAKLDGKLALVLGAEGAGLRRLTRECCDHLVKLPISDLVESLNVSNAAAVALYELARR